LTGRAETAHDIAQDSVLRFFQHLDRFDPSRPIEPWLYQIVRNRVRDLMRRESLRRHESLDAWLEQGLPEAVDRSADPAADAERDPETFSCRLLLGRHGNRARQERDHPQKRQRAHVEPASGRPRPP